MALNLFKKKKNHRQRRQLITHQQPKSPISEQYRNIRTNIEFAAVDKNLHSLMVTSANPSEGKTTTTANMAVVFAQQGKKVLLIDADMRKPAMHQMFQVDNIFGLTNVLTHSERLEKCVQTTSVDNLHFLACGPIPPNPAELLGSKSMQELLAQAYSTYDLVIFDLPPILAVTDAQIMANVCDASILVVRSESTDKETAVKAKGLLESAKGKLLGVVLNDREREQGLYYYYGAN
ncbi:MULTISPECIES: CpsD/CapB family tyrosine-protein kinase [Bacillus]|uniref:non-specific protein-tyrosine kinase n=2 Tax=Bacillus cereus group TaxID=86661 RepID=Q72XH8_BACC1|nr:MULTISPECIES: CpsD/CapB family tyrosine-protein kinase [Bacillus]AAS44298.1 capsular exopolysaccharide family protein [Bacillus cereus ATCC 10987]AIE81732.1 capsular exopolysaccharide family protein [Bacillus cereus]KMQ29135.1 tyrosine protein kinase [Bacillus cereus]KYQ02401.1 Tyrosine-protein kinase EpsD [Bacillus cereus]MCU5155363.1 CpsD/CapB family tyrosine-protein kinase [Bacillus pacificus]